MHRNADSPLRLECLTLPRSIPLPFPGHQRPVIYTPISLLMLSDLRLLSLMLCRTFLCISLLLVRIFRHDILKVAPERLYRRELVTDLGDFFEGAIELVDVL